MNIARSNEATVLPGPTHGGAIPIHSRRARIAALNVVAPRHEGVTDHLAPLRERMDLDGVVGVSKALAVVLREVELVAPLDVAVLVTGETGTGKTQLARVIHDNGPRRGRPFVELNCAAIPDTLLENELFGAVPGAHSTAARRIEGKIAAAEGGTLFLDEIGELSLTSQAKLLQFLHTKQYYPLGSPSAVTANVRVIAATNSELEEAVRQRRFRSDLFFRLNVIGIRMPSLVERGSDITALAQFFSSRAQRAHRLSPLVFAADALRAIEAAEWRGNVRQLANAIESATIRAAAAGARTIEATDVLRENSALETPGALSLRGETRRFQKQLITRTLEAHSWNVAAAACALQVTRAHLYNLMKTLGLARPPATSTQFSAR